MYDPSAQTKKDPGYIAALPRVAIQAFCETPEISDAMQAASVDRRMDKTHLKVQMGGAAAAAESYRYSPTPNVIILESVNGRGEILTHLDTLAEVCDAGTKVVVIGHINDVVLYRELVRRGISDYLIAPISTIEIVRALSDLFAAPDAEPVGRTIAIVGTRGGIGTSTIAHNVSYALGRQLNIETVLVDLDLPFGTAGLDFNQDPLQGIADAVFAPDRLDANLLDRLTTACGEHLNLLAAPATLDRLYDFAETSFDGVVELLQSSVPAIVLDVPHMWTGWTRRLLVGADRIVMVASPDLASLRNAKNMLDVFRQARQHDAKPHLVMNMVGVPKRPEIAVAEFGQDTRSGGGRRDRFRSCPVRLRVEQRPDDRGDAGPLEAGGNAARHRAARHRAKRDADAEEIDVRPAPVPNLEIEGSSLTGLISRPECQDPVQARTMRT